MSSQVRTRQTVNSMEQATLTVNEKILRECNILYTDPERGLMKLAEHFHMTITPPRKKITILLIGNHSAGKSSFINWYIEEHVQKTGVAIETQGFVVVTSGKKRETLMGYGTLQLLPHLKPLKKLEGLVDFLATEISTSKSKKFNLINFIDTPGLVDGNMQYQYDVNNAILWLGKHSADLIFVFFDPIGQALCNRTLTLVEKLNKENADKMRFYLSKADDAGSEADRQKVMMQIVQELCKRPGLNRTGFDMPTIYVPDINKPTKCMNQIDEVCKEIERTINKTVQNALNQLGGESETMLQITKNILKTDNEASQKNKSGLFNCFKLLGLAALIFAIFPEAGLIIALIGIIYGIKWSFYNKLPTLKRRERNSYKDIQSYIETVIRPRKEQLYKEYLEQSISGHDL